MKEEKYYLAHEGYTIYTLYSYSDGTIKQQQQHTEESLKDHIHRMGSEDIQTQYMAMKNRPKTFAHIPIETPIIMGILNKTPDSFSDGGTFMDEEKAIMHGQQLIAEGANIIDIGGESSRPGALDIDEKEERRRVIPTLKALKGKIPISIDTRKASIMEEALENGATIINDISALTDDPKALETIKSKNPYIILMHKSAAPKTMMQHTTYKHVAIDVYEYLKARIQVCVDAGIKKENIAIDPGIGFGKTRDQNHMLHKMAGIFQGLGCPVLWGSSRKTFLTRPEVQPQERDSASIASMLYSISKGAKIVRMHNVKEAKQAIDVWNAINAVSVTCGEVQE